MPVLQGYFIIQPISQEAETVVYFIAYSSLYYSIRPQLSS